MSFKNPYQRDMTVIQDTQLCINRNGIGSFQQDDHIEQTPSQQGIVHPHHGQHIISLLAFDILRKPDDSKNAQDYKKNGQDACPVEVVTRVSGRPDIEGKHRKRHK